jgi:polysaccharide export outer membrane protein
MKGIKQYLTAVLGCLVIGSGNLAAQQTDDLSYRLAAGDRVRIMVYGHEDLSGEFDLSATGTISMPLVQDIQAAGLTLEELEEVITNRLQPDYLLNPSITAEVLNYRPFYIIGEVTNPGSYQYVSGMTVINAVALAGGFTYRARKGRITIVRESEAMPEEIAAGADTPVMPGDVIEVPERFF